MLKYLHQRLYFTIIAVLLAVWSCGCASPTFASPEETGDTSLGYCGIVGYTAHPKTGARYEVRACEGGEILLIPTRRPPADPSIGERDCSLDPTFCKEI